MNRAVIEERIHAAIRPQLARADRALWELQNPRVTIGRHTTEWFQPVEPTWTPIAAGGRIMHTLDNTRRWRPAYHSRLHPRFETP